MKYHERGEAVSEFYKSVLSKIRSTSSAARHIDRCHQRSAMSLNSFKLMFYLINLGLFSPCSQEFLRCRRAPSPSRSKTADQSGIKCQTQKHLWRSLGPKTFPSLEGHCGQMSPSPLGPYQGQGCSRFLHPGCPLWHSFPALPWHPCRPPVPTPHILSSLYSSPAVLKSLGL